MRWTPEAEKAVERVPFFVRKRVMKRVEEEAIRSGAKHVHLEHVQRCKERYLNRMEDEVKGYQVETCFGPSGCPNRAILDDEMAGLLEERISKRNWRTFLEERVHGPLKMHHEFRVSVSDCPNACSRPQIADLGLLGAKNPQSVKIPAAGARHVWRCVERGPIPAGGFARAGCGCRQVFVLWSVHRGMPDRNPPGGPLRLPDRGGRKAGTPSSLATPLESVHDRSRP